jgi:hypothetical protein
MRSSTDNKNGLEILPGHLLDLSFPRTRESRFGLRPISLDTRFRGYDGTHLFIL